MWDKSLHSLHDATSASRAKSLHPVRARFLEFGENTTALKTDFWYPRPMLGGSGYMHQQMLRL
jgi:hypothetical protein